MHIKKVGLTLLQVTEAGNCIRDIAAISAAAREAEISGDYLGGNGTSTDLITIRSQAVISERVYERLNEVTQAQRDLYLGIGKTVPAHWLTKLQAGMQDTWHVALTALSILCSKRLTVT